MMLFLDYLPAFSPQDFTVFVTNATIAGIWIGFLSLVIEIFGAFTRYVCLNILSILRDEPLDI